MWCAMNPPLEYPKKYTGPKSLTFLASATSSVRYATSSSPDLPPSQHRSVGFQKRFPAPSSAPLGSSSANPSAFTRA